MDKVLLQKKRRFRLDPNNPYRTRYMVYSLVDAGRGKYVIEVEQYDYVLRSQVAAEVFATPELSNPASGKQLVEYMLEHAKDKADIIDIYHEWRQGQIPLIREGRNVLVKEALRRRFARNLKKL